MDMPSEYTIDDFSDCELHEEDDARCPECGSNDLDYAMHYADTDETGYNESGEMFQCQNCHATGAVDDADATAGKLPRKPMMVEEDDMERARRAA
jgi:hypothetical protein